MEDLQAQVLARDGNYAVVHLPGRAFPGLHVQGDTFAGLRSQLFEAACVLRDDPGNVDAFDELDYAVAEMTTMLGFYESVLLRRGIRRPY